MHCQFKKMAKYEKIIHGSKTIYIPIHHNALNFNMGIDMKNTILDLGYSKTILFLENKKRNSEIELMSQHDINILTMK